MLSNDNVFLSLYGQSIIHPFNGRLAAGYIGSCASFFVAFRSQLRSDSSHTRWTPNPIPIPLSLCSPSFSSGPWPCVPFYLGT